MNKGRTIKLHRIDGHQVVNLPRGFAPDTDWVTIKREDQRLIITPGQGPFPSNPVTDQN